MVEGLKDEEEKITKIDTLEPEPAVKVGNDYVIRSSEFPFLDSVRRFGANHCHALWRTWWKLQSTYVSLGG